jgi:hypothetical protein
MLRFLRRRLAALVALPVLLLATLTLVAPSASSAATPDFTIQIVPTSQTLNPGTSVAYTVIVGSLDGFNSPVALTVAGLPTGLSGGFAPSTVTPTTSSSASAQLTISASTSATAGGSASPFTVTGTSGTDVHSTGSTVSVKIGLVPLCYGDISGTVTDQTTGTPLSGVTVTSYGSASTTTDAQGTYDLKNVPTGTNNSSQAVSVGFQAPGYYSTYQDATSACGYTAILNAPLTPIEYGAVSGHVYQGTVDTSTGTVTATSAPIANATVSADGSGTTTASDGSYTLSHLTLGNDNASVNAVATAEASGFWYNQSAPFSVVGDTTTANVDIALVPICTGSVTVTVVNASTNKPIAGATVVLSGGKQGTTDSNGQVTITGVNLGYNNAATNVSAYASVPGGLTSYATAALGACGATATTTVTETFNTNNYGSVQATILDADTNQPIAGASLEVGSYPGVTDSSGVVTISNIFVGQNSTTSQSEGQVASATGYYYDYPPSITVNANQTATETIKLTPQLTATITGTVTNASTDAPVPGETVQADGYSAVTDAHGRYTLTGPSMLGAAGASQLDTVSVDSLYQNSAYQYWDTSGQITALAGKTVTLDLQVQPACSGVSISGTVYNASNGQPISGATVSGGDVYTTTGATGQFTLYPITVYENKAFSTTVTAIATNFETAYTTVQLFCGANVTVNFGQTSTTTGTLTGKVTDRATGDPVSGAFVGASFGADTATDSSGDYSFTNVPLGNDNAAESWSVTVTPPSGDGLQAQTKSVSVPASPPDTELDFVLTSAPPPPPTAANYDVTTPYATALTVAAPGLLANDTGTSISVTAVTQPSHGTVTFTANGSYTYAPATGTTGTDSFTYTVTDAASQTATGTVNITVGLQAATAANFTETTPYETALSVPAPGLLSGNPEGATITSFTDPSAGTVSLSQTGELYTGAFTYTPAEGFWGTDSFTYTLAEGDQSATGTVTITVGNPPPAADYRESTPYQTTLAIAAPGLYLDNTSPGVRILDNSDPSHGTVTVNYETGAYTYIPASGFSGPDSFTYTISYQRPVEAMAVRRDGPRLVADAAVDPNTSIGTVTITVGAPASTSGGTSPTTASTTTTSTSASTSTLSPTTTAAPTTTTKPATKGATGSTTTTSTTVLTKGSTGPSTGTGSSGLAATGLKVIQLVSLALLLMVAGTGLLLVARARRRGEHFER